MRVMTYNIQAGIAGLDGVVEVIRGSGADVVALQEVDVRWGERSKFVDEVAYLATQLGMQARFAPIYSLPATDRLTPDRAYGVALLSRYPIVGFTNHALTRMSTVLPGNPTLRLPGFLEATLDVRGRRIRVFNTHLDYRADPTIRRTEVEETLSIIGAVTGPTLLFGDLNAEPGAPELQPLFSRLRDSWPVAAGAGLSYPAEVPRKRIDYVLASAHFRVSNARVIDTRASDHRPVVMDLVVR
jgi:endonuclease/exonuclease/phosphatase family metal-dependent hydrolase